jgi:hypothetical protein
VDTSATEHTIPGLVAAIEGAEQRPLDAPGRPAPATEERRGKPAQ